jgi:secreted trypsin-like serine protease
MPRIAAVLTAFACLIAAAPASAVTGGTPASRDYPFMAALFEDGSWICGSSLVAPDTILTAAHCVEGVKDASTISFEIGGNPLGDPGNERRTATSITVHPQWDSATSRYDVAIAKLDSPSSKAPISIAGPLQTALWDGGSPARVIGYGMPTDPTGLLFEAGIPMVADGNPDDFVGSVDPTTCAGGNLLTAEDLKTMVCAGELYGVKDSCYGDSGGPLLVPSTGDFGATLLQVGVVSWGYACGAPTKYGVYSRIGSDPLNSWVGSRTGAAATTTARTAAKKKAARKAPKKKPARKAPRKHRR